MTVTWPSHDPCHRIWKYCRKIEGYRRCVWDGGLLWVDLFLVVRPHKPDPRATKHQRGVRRLTTSLSEHISPHTSQADGIVVNSISLLQTVTLFTGSWQKLESLESYDRFVMEIPLDVDITEQHSWHTKNAVIFYLVSVFWKNWNNATNCSTFIDLKKWLIFSTMNISPDNQVHGQEKSYPQVRSAHLSRKNKLSWCI